MKELLKDLGLTQLEIKIYTVLLNEGPSLAGIVSQKTGIHRRNVYDCMNRLIEKGLVGYIKENNRQVYSITNPEVILEQLHRRTTEAEKLLPELLAKFNAISGRKEVLFFRGKAGLRQIFEDQIQQEKEILVNATTVPVDHILKYFFPKYQLLRKERKVKTRMIFDASYKRNKKNAEVIRKLPLCKVKYVKDFNKSPMSQYIYGDNVAIVVWGDDPLAILIRQKEIAEGFRDNFELLWKLGA